METNRETAVEHWVEKRLASLGANAEWEPNVAAGLARLQGQLSGNARLPNWTWIIAAASLACIVVMTLPAPRVLAHRCVDCSIALWQGLSNSRAVRAASLLPQPERKMAPDFDLNDASGNPVRISALKGKVVLLNFWATWCGGCQVEIPWFTEFAGKYRDGGLAVVGISMDDDGWKSVKPYIRSKKVNYPIVIGNEDVGKRFGLNSMPMTLMIDRAGRVAAIHVGLVGKGDYVAEIEALLRETVDTSVSPTR